MKRHTLRKGTKTMWSLGRIFLPRDACGSTIAVSLKTTIGEYRKIYVHHTNTCVYCSATPVRQPQLSASKSTV